MCLKTKQIVKSSSFAFGYTLKIKTQSKENAAYENKTEVTVKLLISPQMSGDFS